MREAASFMAGQVLWSTNGRGRLMRSLAAPLRWWKRRRALAKLTTLDDHILYDIGLTRADVRWAMNLPLGHDAAQELQRRRPTRGLRHR
ncbi:DUF1127 domain-containing protein [Propylenella binzhouense]|uniref:DUF1127 domain-containing protein n=1 Tax=Propylenella binzhouense TaxID=2555902 RepID=A0A964T6M0_9HYPH|nr:DUF1127 domain-containing protein [Propylenella binzhouense]MYZ48872.1 DUF1127 domain-containing protein [Propylenella binzhouense]